MGNKSFCSMLLKQVVLCTVLHKWESCVVWYGGAFHSWNTTLGKALEQKSGPRWKQPQLNRALKLKHYQHWLHWQTHSHLASSLNTCTRTSSNKLSCLWQGLVRLWKTPTCRPHGLWGSIITMASPLTFILTESPSQSNHITNPPLMSELLAVKITLPNTAAP